VSAVALGAADESAPEVMLASETQPERLQVEAQRLGRLLACALRSIACRHDQVAVGRRSAIEALPAGELPLGQDAGEGRVDWDAAGDIGLGLLEGECPQRLKGSVVLSPPREAASPCRKPARPLRAYRTRRSSGMRRSDMSCSTSLRS
jgi:hypothetical protein